MIADWPFTTIWLDQHPNLRLWGDDRMPGFAILMLGTEFLLIGDLLAAQGGVL